jgi:hypothetical protein
MFARHAAKRGAALLMFAMALTAAACSRNQTGQAGLQPAKIIFTNESLNQADVFAVIPGVDSRRIGTVFAGRTDTLTLPGDLALRGDVRLVARLLAGGTAGSGVVAVRPGDAIQVRLPLDMKTLVVLPAM